jgi:hypothetical protein
MAKFIVYVRRSERIGFEIEARDAGDAQERYLADGDEVYASKASIEVESVALAEAPS